MSGQWPVATLGRSGVPVTALSFGAAALGNLFSAVTDETAAASVDAAWDAGMRYFDTAPHYGLGLSERRLGAALRGRDRDAYTLSTKVGRLLEPDPGGPGGRQDEGFAVPATHRRVWDFSADGIRRSVEDSLERLGLDRIDVVYLHDPDDHAEQAFREGYPALERLRAEGTVRAIGAGMNQTAMLTRFLRDTDVDAVLCAGRYSLLDQDAARELLPEAAARGRSVVVGGVFNSGLLADPRPGATYDYAAAPMDLLGRALRIKAVAGRHGVPLRAAALSFPFGQSAVVSVLAGARSVREVADAAAMLATPVPAALWAELRAEGLLAADVPVPVAGVRGGAAGATGAADRPSDVPSRSAHVPDPPEAGRQRMRRSDNA
ncbi:aldo/keto reductase [Streptomyces sp. A5-4]|uniref:aldo/keto reductase n=1 Tax=Streptomyces sp. A5-4 TaxID=3384771 RepID=UPI003DA97914